MKEKSSILSIRKNMKGFEKMAKPRPAKEEEVKYAYEYAAEKNININNCEIRISGAGNIVCRDKTTSQDILMIPKAFIPMTIQLQAVSQSPKKTKAETDGTKFNT